MQTKTTAAELTDETVDQNLTKLLFEVQEVACRVEAICRYWRIKERITESQQDATLDELRVVQQRVRAMKRLAERVWRSPVDANVA